MTVDEATIGAYAQTLVQQVAAGGYTLDFSVGSLAILDILLSESESPFTALDDERKNIAIFYIGCYLGEVLCRNLGGSWQFAPNWFDAAIVVPSEHGGIQVRPYDKALRRLTEGEEGNRFTDYLEGLREHLEKLSVENTG